MSDARMEIWKDIKDFPGYQISNLGRVKSFRQGVQILKLSKHTKGYPNVSMRKNGKSVTKTTHRLLAIAFLGLKKDQWVNHFDGDKTNNDLKNLECCSATHNQLHRSWILGRGKERKVSKKQINEIREMRKSGMPYTKIGKLFGYTPNGIRYVCQTEFRDKDPLAYFKAVCLYRSRGTKET